MSDPQDQTFVGIWQMSDICGLPVGYLKKMALDGKVPTIRAGKSLMFDRVGTIEALRRMAAPQEEQP